MCGNGLVEDIVLRAKTFSRVKTSMINDDRACTLFPSWRHCYWRTWTSGAVLVVVILLLQGIDHYSGTFFYNSFFYLVSFVMPLGPCVFAETGSNWYLLDINLYFFIKKILLYKLKKN
jgi:hypothetical protein